MQDFFGNATDVSIEHFEAGHNIAVAYFDQGDEFSVVCPSCGNLELSRPCDCPNSEYLKEMQKELDKVLFQ